MNEMGGVFMLIDVTLKITPKMVKDAQGNEKKSLVGHLGTHSIVRVSLLLFVCFLGTRSVSVLNLFPQCLQSYLVVFRCMIAFFP